MRIQFGKHTDIKLRLMTAERTLFISICGLAILVTNFKVTR